MFFFTNFLTKKKKKKKLEFEHSKQANANLIKAFFHWAQLHFLLWKHRQPSVPVTMPIYYICIILLFFTSSSHAVKK